MPADKITDETDPEIPDGITDPTEASNREIGGGGTEGDSKWIRGGGGGGGGGGWGSGGGYPGAGGYGRGGGGWRSGGDPIPRMPPPSAGEPFYCRPITCGDPYACPGFTLYLNHPAIDSYMSKDVVRGDSRHESGVVVDAMAPESG